ncbi:hypothetical protein E6P09_15600 (plasmid) [Haloferax mediterranei ATCC 33500]|uniref:DUF8115 domain-containing protein n=2 Tax=Haloferacaceae TaxID=1644056 RepID=I3RBI4_HALMT|nr:hypothetical protein HFX_6478 [Haloferax mediterranei ATCC 33500]AHZ24360.1 hypothetical protein BM92_15660 [Haloferax mediterranei ATCC 33500]ELZ97095.1 hypothetical protein C439_17273 [Haloferax mediterranei ATCC 33500]QCQ76766.1 hypothetical protein E6P09_15600 [Haloferax mediterranei ATCC 33500]
MSDDKPNAEELLQSAKSQKRHTSEPTKEMSTDDSGNELVGAVEDAYQGLENDDLNQTLSLRDANLAALFAALESTGGLNSVGKRALEYLERDETTNSKADVLKALVRVGLSEVATEELEAGAEGRRQFERSKIEDYDF